jgi:type II secretory pathway pseudopilin PulG
MHNIFTDGINATSNTESLAPAQHSVIQSHSAWIDIPSLRQLSPVLYENLRRLVQDLMKKENECNDLESKVRNLKTELTGMEDQVVRQKAIVSTSMENQSTSLEYYKKRADDADKETVQLRTAKSTLDQVRQVFLSYPGGLEALSRVVRQPMNESTHTSKPASRGASLPVPKSMPLESEDDFLKIPYQYVPGIVSRIISHRHTSSQASEHIHTSSTAGVGLYSADVGVFEGDAGTDDTEHVNMELHAQLSAATADNAELREHLIHLESVFKSKDTATAHTEAGLRRELDAAVELVEKQNALTVALEAKLESMKRDRQARGAQIVTLQQREEALRHRILQCCEDAAAKVGVSPYTIPPVDSSLPDMFSFYVELFQIAAQSAFGAAQHTLSKSMTSAPGNACCDPGGLSYTSPGQAMSYSAQKLSLRESGLPSSAGGCGVDQNGKIGNDMRGSALKVSSGRVSPRGRAGRAGRAGASVTTSLLHDRLQKAQQAFASLKER